MSIKIASGFESEGFPWDKDRGVWVRKSTRKGAVPFTPLDLFNPSVDFAVWTLMGDGLCFPPFNRHEARVGELQLAGMTESLWMLWCEFLVGDAVDFSGTPLEHAESPLWQILKKKREVYDALTDSHEAAFRRGINLEYRATFVILQSSLCDLCDMELKAVHCVNYCSEGFVFLPFGRLLLMFDFKKLSREDLVWTISQVQQPAFEFHPT